MIRESYCWITTLREPPNCDLYLFSLVCSRCKSVQYEMIELEKDGIGLYSYGNHYPNLLQLQSNLFSALIEGERNSISCDLCGRELWAFLISKDVDGIFSIVTS